MDNFITAEEAKIKTKRQSMQHIVKTIQNAIDAGSSSCTFTHIHDDHLIMLSQAGYTISKCNNSITVDWE